MKGEYRMVLYTIETTDGIEWVAEYPDLKGCCGGGKTQQEAINDAEENKEAFLITLAEEGKEIPIATNPYDSEYSGKCTVRMSKSLHKNLAIMADEENISMNQLIIEAISEKIQKNYLKKSERYTVMNSYNTPMQSVYDGWLKMLDNDNTIFKRLLNIKQASI